MSLRTWLQSFVVSGAIAWSLLPTSAGAQQPAPPAGEAQPLPDVDVVVEPQQAPNLTPNFNPFTPTTVLDDNPFQASVASGYATGSTTTGNWVAIPDIVNPQTVTTITGQVLKDQQIIFTDDLIRNIGGAVKGFGTSGGDGVRRPDQFLLRGFEMSSQNFRKNGFLDPTYTPRDYANVERVEIIKGPAALAYGSAFPAGTFNVVTKRAVQDRFAVSTLQVGSWDLFRSTIDVNNMNQSGDILFRLNGSYTNTDSFRDFYVNERSFLAPTMTLLLSDDTVLTYEAEYNDDRRQYDSGLVAINGDPEALPRSRFLGNPGGFFKNHDYRSTITLTHMINDDWSLFMGESTLFYDFQNFGTQPAGGPTSGGPFSGTFFTNNPPGFLSRQQFQGGQKGYSHDFVVNLNGKWNGPLFRHNSLIGTEQAWTFQRGNFPSSVPGADSSLFIDPQSPGPFTEEVANPSFTFSFPGLYQFRSGVYFQDIVELTDRLHFIYGGRYDHIGQTSDTLGIFAKNSFDEGTPKVGLTYQLVPELLSLYGLYTTTFNPIGGAAFGIPGPGANTDPELGRIWEGGVKAQLTDEMLLTVGGFQIDRWNVATQPATGFTYLQADQVSKGVEVNLIGNWTDRLSTIANYAYTDAKQDDANGGPFSLYDISGRIRGVPFNTANAWTRYNVIQERNRVFGVGLGWVYVGDRRGDYGGLLGSPLVLDSYNRFDLGLFGQVGRWTADTYIENLFDTHYSAGSISQYQVFPGAPINVRFMLGARF